MDTSLAPVIPLRPRRAPPPDPADRPDAAAYWVQLQALRAERTRLQERRGAS